MDIIFAEDELETSASLKSFCMFSFVVQWLILYHTLATEVGPAWSHVIH